MSRDHHLEQIQDLNTVLEEVFHFMSATPVSNSEQESTFKATKLQKGLQVAKTEVRATPPFQSEIAPNLQVVCEQFELQIAKEYFRAMSLVGDNLSSMVDRTNELVHAFNGKLDQGPLLDLAVAISSLAEKIMNLSDPEFYEQTDDQWVDDFNAENAELQVIVKEAIQYCELQTQSI